ncbi:MAG: hypothetical protein ACK449_04950 [Planctomycetota bacterium]
MSPKLLAKNATPRQLRGAQWRIEPPELDLHGFDFRAGAIQTTILNQSEPVQSDPVAGL